jgi:hypothetical protein
MTVKNLFDPDLAEEVNQRLMSIQPDSARQWGSMEPAQAFSHCTRGLQMAMGIINPRRASFPANIIGLSSNRSSSVMISRCARTPLSSPELFPARTTAMGHTHVSNTSIITFGSSMDS